MSEEEPRFDELLLGLAKHHTDGVPGVCIIFFVFQNKFVLILT